MWPVPQAGNVPANPGLYCAVFAVDIAGFGDLARDDQVRLFMRDALYRVLGDAFDASGVPWTDTLHEDRGDGVLVLVPATVPQAYLFDPLLDRLRRMLHDYNRTAGEIAKIRLRASLHAGQVYQDAHGLAGVAVNHAFRLLEAEALKNTLRVTEAQLAFITSDTLYEDVVRHGRPGLIDPAAFQEVTVDAKETHTQAWIHLPGMGPSTAWPASVAITPPRSGPPGRGGVQGIIVHGDAHFGGDFVAGDKHVHGPAGPPGPGRRPLPPGAGDDDDRTRP